MSPAWEAKRTYNTFVENTLGKQPLRRYRSSWNNKIWIGSRDSYCEDSR
jgi:hypothetical protein